MLKVSSFSLEADRYIYATSHMQFLIRVRYLVTHKDLLSSLWETVWDPPTGACTLSKPIEMSKKKTPVFSLYNRMHKFSGNYSAAIWSFTRKTPRCHSRMTNSLQCIPASFCHHWLSCWWDGNQVWPGRRHLGASKPVWNPHKAHNFIPLLRSNWIPISSIVTFF